MNPILFALYIAGAMFMCVASRKSMVSFRDGLCILAWPLFMIIRAFIFLVEGNLWEHLD